MAYNKAMLLVVALTYTLTGLISAERIEDKFTKLPKNETTNIIM